MPRMNLPIQIKHMPPLLPRISIFLCRASHVNYAELAVIWTHDRDVRGMGLLPNLCHKLLCIFGFKEILGSVVPLVEHFISLAVYWSTSICFLC